MTHTHFRCSNKKKKRKEKGLKLQPYRDLRPVNFNFKRSVVTELRIERSRSCSHSHRYNRHLHRHHHFQPQPQDPTVFPELHSTLPVYQFPGPVYHDYLADLSPTITRKWMTSAGFSDQALWPPGPTIRSSGDTVFRVFLGEAVNISTGEDCLENPAASRSGARLAEERGRQTGAWPQIVVAIERSHYRQR